MKKVVLLLPFWGNPDYVGNVRAERLIRFFHQCNWTTTIIRAGKSDHIEDMDTGKVITVRDPLSMHGDIDSKGGYKPKTRKPNRLRRWLGYALVIPDPAIFWANRALKNAHVIQELVGAQLLFVSAPPESSLVVASRWAQKRKCPFWMDMRDGWLDEPMKPLLRAYKIQKWREKRLESTCLRNALFVTVTSDIWKKMLIDRYTMYDSKVCVLQNASANIPLISATTSSNSQLHFIYAGKLAGSRPERSDLHQFTTFVDILKADQNITEAHLDFRGKYTYDEQLLIRNYAGQNSDSKVQINFKDAVSRTEIIKIMQNCSGLLLLSPSMGCIPAKFFEYLTAGRPILLFTLENSALAQAASQVEHCFVIHDALPHDHVQLTINAFIAECKKSGNRPIPECFTEDENFQTFKRILKKLE